MKGRLIDIVSIQIRNYKTYDTRAQQAHSLALLTRAIKTTQNCFVTKFNAKSNKILFLCCAYICASVQKYRLTVMVDSKFLCFHCIFKENYFKYVPTGNQVCTVNYTILLN